MSVKYFTNGNIMDVVNEKIYKGSIVVEDGIIKEVGENIACPEGAEVIDFGGNYVSPGLFNCHVHTVLDVPKAADGRHKIATATIKGIQNCQKYLRSGVTYVRDVGAADFVDIDLRNAINAGLVDGPEMVVSGKCICMTGGHGWTGGREADGPDDARKAAREMLRAGADWIKVMATGGVMTNGVEPGSPQLTEEELRAAIEEAHKVNAKACTHAQGMVGIKNALRAGVDSIEHGFYMDDWCFDWMKEHDTFYVPTLAAMYWIYVNPDKVPDFVIRKVRGAFEAHKATFKAAYEAGVKIALGTDAGTPFNEHDMTAYEMVLMVESGMTNWDAVKTGTVNAAELCDVSATNGTIEVGKKANFTVYGGNPIEDINAVMDCRMTVVKGKVMFAK